MKLLMLILLCTACGSANPTIIQPRLIAFGDSFTYRPGWATVVANNLDKELVNLAQDSTNLSSDNQLPLMLRFSYRPNDVVVMLLGYNDVVKYQKDAAGLLLFKQELAQLVSHYSSLGIQTYIGTACNVPAYYDATYGLDTSDRPLYVQAIKDAVAAGAPNIHLVDVNAQFIPVVDVTLLVDQHPNAYGHELIAQWFLEVIHD